MNITELDFDYIELFDLAYTIAGEVFDVDPTATTSEKQKKIRNWVKRTYIDDSDFPKNVMCFIDDSVSDSEFIAFLAECSKLVKVHGTKKRQLLMLATKDFSDDVQKAFVQLFEDIEYCDTAKVRDDRFIILLEDTTSYRRSLVLHTVPGTTVNKYELYIFSDAQIIKDENYFKLVCTAEDPERDASAVIEIFFDNVTVETDIYRADRSEFYDNPWETLSMIANDILGKSHLGPSYMNEKEKALVPLLTELRSLSLWTAHDGEQTGGFAILKQYLEKYGLTTVIPLLHNVAVHPVGKIKSYMAMSKLSGKLNESACEPLWRELYGLISDSQEEYEDKILNLGSEKLNKIRTVTEEKLHALGYSGKYPTFRKRGIMRGFKLERSYDQSYFIGAEKNVEYIIHCIEVVNDGRLYIQFLSGTALLKKGETIDDIYSCCFNKKGRRLFKKIYFDGEDVESAEKFIITAAKRAECLKLTKEEKALVGSGSVSWRSFALLFLFAGGLFAGLMTAVIFLVCCIVTAVITGPGSIHEMITEMPWWIIFSVGFVGFGGGMAVVETIAKKK